MAKTRQEAIAELTAPGETYELYEGSVLGRKCLKFKNAPPTLRELFQEAKSETEFTRLRGYASNLRRRLILKRQKLAHILIQRYGIQNVGVAGHPEGSPDITQSEIADALAAKNDWPNVMGLICILKHNFVLRQILC